ncbi:hypothetical protein RN001_008657 [Aquatica leii]|uniref:Uncharacterized protein n=1 Tax=Aquatica leii TaxID=1421715 RepID=A0AAN7PDL1_9COLE|nr:hypothetical protein RN001_008657 [Aquatica leii]
MKRHKKSGDFYRKQKKVREEESKKNKEALLKYLESATQRGVTEHDIKTSATTSEKCAPSTSGCIVNHEALPNKTAVINAQSESWEIEIENSEEIDSLQGEDTGDSTATQAKNELAREIYELKQDAGKKHAEKARREVTPYNAGDSILVYVHQLSNSTKQFTFKLALRRNGPYLITKRNSFTSYQVAHIYEPDELLGNYHVSALKPHIKGTTKTPICPIRPRGKPKKSTAVPTSDMDIDGVSDSESEVDVSSGTDSINREKADVEELTSDDNINKQTPLRKLFLSPKKQQLKQRKQQEDPRISAAYDIL